MKLLIPILVCAVLLVGCDDKDEPLPRATPPPVIGREVPLGQYGRSTVSINNIEIPVYVADEAGERAEGLKFVKKGELGENEGMVFVFSSSEQLSFWMENTLIPLDIAYLDEDGQILNIRQMQPLDLSPQPSSGPARYAVEMNEGWFAKNNVEAGDKFDLSKID